MDLDKTYDDALARYDGSNWDELSERDRVLVTIWGLEADVNNGGFHQYFSNSSGNQAHYAEAALRRIGADAMARIVSRATPIFGTSGVPRDRYLRQEVLEQVEDACEDLLEQLDTQFCACPDDLSELMKLYLADKP